MNGNSFERKLLPCAHCGDTDVRLLRTVSNNVVAWHVECMGCGIRTGDYGEYASTSGELSLTRGEVASRMRDAVDCCVSSWNNRSSAHKSNNESSHDSRDTSGETLGDLLGLDFGVDTFFDFLDDMFGRSHSWSSDDDE